MKKYLFIGLATAAMFASCSSDETLEVAQPKAIGFSTFVDKSTRGIADDITSANITNFSVYGFMENASGMIFNNEAVTGSGYLDDKAPDANPSWSYANTQYWTAGKTYWFSAIAPTTGAQWSYDVNGKTTGGIITFTNGEGKQDLLYAYNGPITCTDPAKQGEVEFTFSHLLSRVKFNFENAMTNDNIYLVVRDVKITDANNKATCDVSATTKTWTLANDNVAGVLAFDAVPGAETKIAKDAAIATDHKYMIPLNQVYKLNFVVDMYQGEVLAQTFTHTAVAVPEVDMKAGYSYVFNAELNPQNINPNGQTYPIEFTVKVVEDWQDFTGSDITLPENPAASYLLRR